MIRDVRQFTCRVCDAVIIGHIYFQNGGLALLLNLLSRFATSLRISRAYKYMKSFGCKLLRHFVANAFVRPGNQRRLHVDPDSAQSSLSVCKKSFSNGCGFEGNSSTSLNFFVIARERTSTSSILRDACSIFSFTALKDSPNLLNSLFTAASRCQTSLERFWIASVRKPICKLFNNAASVVGPTKVTRQSRCTF